MVIFKKDLNLECDPDFGKYMPEDIVAFKVIVYKPCDAVGKIGKNEIMLAVPKLDDYDSELKIAHKVMQIFCENGDNYQLIKFSNEDASSFDASKPVIGFDPALWEASEILGFFWLVPPLECRN